jgi:release factor glutamine methyltransferase
MTYQEYTRIGKERLLQSGVEVGDALDHMHRILEAVLRLSSTERILKANETLSPGQLASLENVLQRRCAGEPLQYILGEADFWNSRFKVGKGVLIPRPETELLVEKALERIVSPSARIAELGAGSGAIGITCLLERPKWEWFAWELNPASLSYCRTNLSLLGSFKNYHLLEADFFNGFGTYAPFDWIVANPPYIRRSEIPTLSREVSHEPTLALDGGITGLEVLEKMLSPRIIAALTPGGGVLLEIGEDQGPAVLRLLEQVGLVESSIEKDLAGRDRVAYGRKPK